MCVLGHVGETFQSNKRFPRTSRLGRNERPTRHETVGQKTLLELHLLAPDEAHGEDDDEQQKETTTSRACYQMNDVHSGRQSPLLSEANAAH